MKKLLRNKLRSILNLDQLENKLESINSQKEIISLELLKNLWPVKSYFPITSWSISPNALVHISNDIIINQRKNIIEFGPGYSTLIIARLIQLNNLQVKFYAIESDEKFAKILEDALIREGLIELVNIIVAPLVDSPYSFKEHSSWYSRSVLEEKLKDFHDIDLVIVDGPPGAFSYTRYGAIPFIKNKLKTNYTIFLDDTTRAEESEIAREWSRELNAEIEFQKNYTLVYNKKGPQTRPFYVKYF